MSHVSDSLIPKNLLELCHYATGYSLKKSIPEKQTKIALLSYRLRNRRWLWWGWVTNTLHRELKNYLQCFIYKYTWIFYSWYNFYYLERKHKKIWLLKQKSQMWFMDSNWSIGLLLAELRTSSKLAEVLFCNSSRNNDSIIWEKGKEKDCYPLFMEAQSYMQQGFN